MPSNPSHGWNNDNDPYRCELYAIAIGLYTLRDLEMRHNTGFHSITLSVDNDQALFRSSNTNIHITTSSQHYDLLWSIHKVLADIRTPVSIEQVTGHQDNITPIHQLPRPAQLNIECDAMAKHIRTHYHNNPLVQPSMQLPYEDYSLWIDQRKIYSHTDLAVHTQASYHNTLAYYKRKHRWTDEMFNSINWDACGLAMKSVTPATRVLISKLSCGFAGLGSMLDKRDYWKTGACPRCDGDTETLIHMLSCKDPAAHEKMTHGIENVRSWMIQYYTEQTLADEIARTTLAWTMDTTLQDFWSPFPPIMMQIHLGWHHFLLGRIHIEFTHSQHAYFRRSGLHRSALSWTKRLIVILWSDIIRPQ